MAVESTNAVSSNQSNLMFRTNLSDMSRYMRFIGIFYIIGGALYCLGIITAVIGVPIIIMGLRLKEAAESFGQFAHTKKFRDISLAIEKQKTFFHIAFILLIIGLVLMGIYFLILIGMLVIGLTA